ncbi:MAG: nickel-dependent lactate racemase [Candidatus Adiutrix sp.]|nr:nickel-dependent lactate racemase [Candidatus Adiutrix sp.]
MKIDLPWLDGSLSVNIPDQNLGEILSPNPCPPLADPGAAVEAALSAPIGLAELRAWVRPGRKVLIISDDNTRLTPVDRLLPPLLRRLNQAGVPDGAVTVLMALGTHRYMSQEELRQKVGPEMFRRLTVVNHLWQDEANLADLGRTENGIPLKVNKLLMESEIIIGLGAVVPHHIPGFSGGAKIIQPGVCGPETTAETHLLSCRGGGDSLLGQIDNPVRRALDEMGLRVGLSAVINVVLTPDGRTAGVFFGHYQEAFRAAVDLARKIYGVEYRLKPDIVLSNSHPCDLDFWQAHKAQYPAQIMVKPGGSIILTTPCPEGLSPVHTELKNFTHFSSREIQDKYRAGELKNGVAVALATAWAMVREKASIITYSPGLSDEEIRALGHSRAAGPDQAVAEALRRQGPEAKISVLTHAPDLLPIWAGRERP